MALSGPARLLAQVRLGFALLVDPRVPVAAKLAVPLAMVYFLNPWDIVADFAPIIGRLDDLALLVGAFGLMRVLVPEALRHQHEADAGLRPRPAPKPADPRILEGSYRVVDD
jgi:uncharacterized membrane protein YkvA (DUF1232 family)